MRFHNTLVSSCGQSLMLASVHGEPLFANGFW
jgi:hypothetical protein